MFSVPLDGVGVDVLPFVVEFLHVIWVIDQQVFKHSKMIMMNCKENRIIALQILSYPLLWIVILSTKHLKELLHVKCLTFILIIQLAVTKQPPNVLYSLLPSLYHTHTRSDILKPLQG